ncbi:MAG: pilus assembly protein PilM [Proteobacteria bacterium]|nr:pilus assembly protein PilM [Pseudomonadota bacterium]
MPEKILGLDIQTDAVRAVVVRPGLKSAAVEAHAQAPVDPELGWEPALEEVLAELSVRVNLERIICHAAFGASGVSFRNLNFPFSETRKIRQILPFELESQLPFKADEILADYHLVEKGERTRCVVAAAREEKVAGRLMRLEEHGVLPTVLGVDGAALALTYLSTAQPEEPGVFLHITPFGAVMVLFSDRTLLSVRNMDGDFSGRHEQLATEIRIASRALEELAGRSFWPEKAVLSGPGAAWPGLEGLLKEALSVRVERLDLVRTVGVSMDPGLAEAWNPFTMDAALALALDQPTASQGFNLRQGPYAVQEKWHEYRGAIFRAAVLAGIVLLAFAGRFFIQTHMLETEVARLNDRILAVYQEAVPGAGAVPDPVGDLAARIEAMRRSVALPGENLETPVKVVDVLKAVSENIPQDIDLAVDSFIVSRDGLQLGGDTATFNSVDGIKAGLEKIPFLDKVTIVSADTERQENRVRFRIKARLVENI